MRGLLAPLLLSLLSVNNNTIYPLRLPSQGCKGMDTGGQGGSFQAGPERQRLAPPESRGAPPLVVTGCRSQCVVAGV